MLWAVLVIIVALWFLGLTLHVAGSMIHLLLVFAMIILIVNLVAGRRRAL